MLCAFDKEKLSTASMMAKASGGGCRHYKVAEIYSYSSNVKRAISGVNS